MVSPRESGEFPDNTSIDPTEVAENRTPAQMAAEFGRFDPPEDFSHGDEFESPIPRPIPKVLRRGSFARRKHGVAMTWTALGAAFVMVAPWNIIWKLSFYVLPLAYLGWIGTGMIVIGLIVLIRNRYLKERFEYVASGQPIVGRILDVRDQETVTINQETKALIVQIRYQVTVEYENPENRRQEFAVLITDEFWDKSQSAKYSLDVEPGDYVTLVAMPGNIAGTLKLYGLLGLDPQRDFLKYRGKPLSGVSPLSAIAISVVVFSVLWMLVGVLCLTTYIPEEWNWPIGLTALGIGGVVGAILGLVIERFGNQENNERKASSAVVAACACGLFGCFGGALGLGLINSVFDKSPSTYQPIEIVNQWNTTHNFVFRDYELEYSGFGNGKSDKAHVSVDTLMRIGTARFGVIERRAGALGLDWIAGFHPVEWMPLEGEPNAEQAKVAVTVRSGAWGLIQLRQIGFQPDAKMMEQAQATDAEGKTTQVVPVILLPDGETPLAPIEMVERAKVELQGAIK